MKLDINNSIMVYYLCLALISILFSSCTYSSNAITGLKPDGQSKMVLYGYLSPGGVDLTITKSIPTGESFQREDLLLDEPAECILWSNDTIIGEIAYDPILKKYTYTGEVVADKTYRITATASNLPEVEVVGLTFPPPPEQVHIEFLTNSSERTTPVRVSAISHGQTHFLLIPLIEESVDAEFTRNPSIETEYDALYRDECGIVHSVFRLSFSNACSTGDSTLLEGNYTYPNYYFDDSNTGVRTELPPDRIGVQIGTISLTDYGYFKSTRTNQNFFEDYLTREPLDQYNISGGYGRIVVINGPPPFWHKPE